MVRGIPGSGSNLVSAPATAFAYDQKLGGNDRLLFAGQMNYDQDAPAGSIATVWLPTGSLARVRIRRWFCAKPSWGRMGKYSAACALNRADRWHGRSRRSELQRRICVGRVGSCGDFAASARETERARFG